MGGGDREPAVAQAVAVIGHREPGLRRGPLLLPLQRPCFVGVGAGGVGDLQDPLAQDPQHLRVVVLRGGEEVLLRPLGQVGIRGQGPHVGVLAGGVGLQVLAELIHGPADHLRLLDPDLAPGQRLPRQRVRLECRGQPGLAVRLAAGDPRGVAQPGRRGRRAGLGVRLHRVRVGQQPRLELGDPRDQRGQVAQRPAGARGVQDPQRPLARVVEHLARRSDRPEHRVPATTAGFATACHDDTLPPPADTPAPSAQPCGRAPDLPELCTRPETHAASTARKPTPPRRGGNPRRLGGAETHADSAGRITCSRGSPASGRRSPRASCRP